VLPNIFLVGKYRSGIVRMPTITEASLALHSLTPHAFNICAVRMMETGNQFLAGGVF
jgi:hypothetical protein